MFSRREYLLMGVFVALAAFFFFRGCDKHIDSRVLNTSLPEEDSAKFIVNGDKLTVLTPGKEETIFLPDRPSSIEINKSGEINITAKQFGTELKPFLGLQMSNVFRLGAGIDAVYYKKWDLGVGVADRVGNYTPVVFTKISYLIWSNTQLGITYDSSTHVGLSLTVRL